MRVCEVTEFGGPDVLRVSARAWPVPRDGEVVVEIEAATVNPTDLAARSGAARRRIENLKPPFVPGWDLAGVIADGAASGEFEAADVPLAAMCTCTAMIRFFHPQMIAQSVNKPGPSLDQMIGFVLAGLAPRGKAAGKKS